MNQQSVGAPTSIPFCNWRDCGKPLHWVPPGIAGPRAKNPGQPYEGFWACPDKHPQRGIPSRADSPGLPPAARTVQTPQSPPPALAGSVTIQESRERSIAAQAACKAACEAFAGAGPAAGTGSEAQHDWILCLARKLYNEIIMPAAQGKELEDGFARF